MIYTLAAGTAASGVLAALVLGGGALLEGRSGAGLPWLVPALFGALLLAVAVWFSGRWSSWAAEAESIRPSLARRARARKRRAVALSNLYRGLATCYALGAACAALVPLRAWLELKESPAAELAHLLAVVALAFYALRALILNVRLAWRVKSRATSSTATACALAIGSAFAAVVAGPPAAALVPTVAAIVYGLNIAAPVAQLALLPRRAA